MKDVLELGDISCPTIFIFERYFPNIFRPNFLKSVDTSQMLIDSEYFFEGIRQVL